MISYVECLGGEGAGPGVSSHCWNGGPDEERDELLPRKIAALQPKMEGSLRRRLLSAKIYQQQTAMLRLNASGTNRPASPQLQCNPWHLPPRQHVHPSLPPETHGKLFFSPETCGKPQIKTSPLQVQRPSCPVLTHLRRTSSCPPTPEPRPGYALPVHSPLSVTNPPKNLEVPLQYRYQPTKTRKNRFFLFRHGQGRRSKQEALPTTPLLQKGNLHHLVTLMKGAHVHWRPASMAGVGLTQKPQQGLRFIPRKRRSGSADDLRASSDEDEKFFLTNPRPMTPLVLNPISLTSGWDELGSPSESIPNMEMEPIQRLPTPEEKMRKQAEAVAADIVPINVTGESFDRQASFRRTISNADSLNRRPNKLSRRKTVSAISDDVIPKPSVSVDLPGQYSTVGRPSSLICPSSHQQKSREVDLEESEDNRKDEQFISRRIRAPKGDGMSSLMASLTSSPNVGTQPVSCSSSSSEIHSLPRMPTNSSLSSEVSFNSTTYRTLSASSSSCSQDQQGFPSDLQPLLPYDPNARVIPQSPSSSSSCFPSSPVNSCNSDTPSQLQSDWSYPSDLNDSPSCHLSSSSIADSVSQFSYQALDDQTMTQENAQNFSDGDSCSGESWSYRPLSPSSSIHSSITQDTRCVSEEEWNCDLLLASGRSTPFCIDNTSLSSEKIPSSPSLNREKRKSSTSAFYSHTSRSISLRKSKRPPPPPLRSDSLRRRPGRSKASRSSTSPRPDRSPRVDRSTLHTPISSSQTFPDPWVPRSNAKRRQSGLNCGTVTTFFEPLSPNSQKATNTDSDPSGTNLMTPKHCHGHNPESPSSVDKDLEIAVSHPPDYSVAGLQRLASPSSGYSSQSNTPSPGTPVSSPHNPSSPLTASPGEFSLPPTSPFFSSCSSTLPLSPTASSLPRTRSRTRKYCKPNMTLLTANFTLKLGELSLPDLLIKEPDEEEERGKEETQQKGDGAKEADRSSDGEF
ncbi:hypothetical protein GOODEAATRI_001851 [Goodea atripinnis]|uniref:NHS-like protein 1 n=1 Tax=Goodea atripinnis TaxID=208336 RepID=A0ABV0PUK9_9TELE